MIDNIDSQFRVEEILDAVKQRQNDYFLKRNDLRRKRDQHWTRLRLARKECGVTSDHFIKWLEDTYGLRLIMDNSMITDDYTVVDETKYTMYLLKFAH